MLAVSAFDPAKAAKVQVVREQPLEFLDDGLRSGVRQGAASHVPAHARRRGGSGRRGARIAAPRINAAYYHGGEPIRVIRPFLEGEAQQAVLSRDDGGGTERAERAGLDTVIIDDSRFTNVIVRGRNVLTRCTWAPTRSCRWRGACTGVSPADVSSS